MDVIQTIIGVQGVIAVFKGDVEFQQVKEWIGKIANGADTGMTHYRVNPVDDSGLRLMYVREIYYFDATLKSQQEFMNQNLVGKLVPHVYQFLEGPVTLESVLIKRGLR